MQLLSVFHRIELAQRAYWVLMGISMKRVLKLSEVQCRWLSNVTIILSKDCQDSLASIRTTCCNAAPRRWRIGHMQCPTSSGWGWSEYLRVDAHI